MNNEKIKELVEETNKMIYDEVKKMPNDIETLKILLSKVLAYNKIILDKLNKYTG